VLKDQIEKSSLNQKQLIKEDLIDEQLAKTDEQLISQFRQQLTNGNITPTNVNFIFHNKLPKSGSTTFNYLLLILSKKNNFKFEKITSGSLASSIQENAPTIEFVKHNFKPPYFLLKHQFFVDFSKEDIRPTYINIIREPLDWITSRFYFNRYGWKRDPGCRGEGCSMSKEEHAMSLDECVLKRKPLCTSSTTYFSYLCGPSSECNDVQKDHVYEVTRKRLLKDYFFVGILEHFEETLQALEILLPQYFKGAVDVWKSENIQYKQKLTVTQHKKPMNEASRNFYLNGVMKYESKL